MDEIPTEAYYDLTRIRETTVSPTGERVAFVTEESDPDADEPVRSLWVVPADGSEAPYRLTRASEASSPTWGPDGDRLGFLAARETDPDLRVGRDDDAEPGEGEASDGEGDGDGNDENDEEGDDGDGDGADAGDDDEPKPQLWTFDLRRGGDARQVTDREEGVTAFDWGPDGERVVIAARDPTDDDREQLEQRREGGPIEVERLQHKFDGAGYLDQVASYLFVVDLADRETERLDEATDGGYGGTFRTGLQPAWGPSGRIAFVANHTDRPDANYVADVYTIEPDGSDHRKLTDGELACGALAWGPDGDRLAFAAQPEGNWYVPREIYVADVESGDYGSVSGDLDRTLARGGRPQWLGEDRLVALVGDEGRTRLVECDPDGVAERAFERQGDYEALGSLSVGGRTLAFTVARPDDGADLYGLDAAALHDDGAGDDPRTRLTDVNADLLDGQPAPGCRRVAFESADGTEVEGIAYHPADFDPEDPDPRPTILDIHGGPMAYDEPTFRFQDRYFTSRGYVVLKVNYRGSTSYGREFCETLRGNWGTRDVEDLLAGVEELVDRGWADPERLFPTGFSQGGVNTGYLVTRDVRWAAAAAEHGIYDFRACFGTDDSQGWWADDYGVPWENPEAYEEHSSITDVGNVETPLLITAGGEDWRCPPGQAEQLYVSVRKQGVDAKLVVYQDEHHNVGDPDRAIHRLEELRDWFAAHDPGRTDADD